MTFFVRNSANEIVGEYADTKAIKVAAQSNVLAPGNYTIWKEVGSFTAKEVPTRVSVAFRSSSQRGPRKSKGEGKAVSGNGPEATPKKRKGLFNASA